MGRRARVNAKKRNRRIVVILIAVAIVAVVVVLAFVIQASTNNSNSKYIGQPVSSSIMQQLTGVSDSTLNAVGIPSSITKPAAISGQALTVNGKPEVLYIGGEFCPFCAVERWSMVVALSHFGNFSGLQYMQSSPTDTNPNTPTFTFRNSNFTSKYIVFVPVEEFNRATSTVQTLDSAQQSIFSQYGSCASSGQAAGIPFIDIANSYAVNCGAQLSLPQIAGENWTTVASQLNTPSSQVAQQIDGTANSLIAAICKADGGQPASVCGQSYATATFAQRSYPAVQSSQQILSMISSTPEASRWTS